MKNKILIFLLLISSLVVYGNLPPTSSKISGDATGVTTFNFEFPNFTGTHNGSTVTLGTLSIAGGGTGSASQNFVDLTTPQTIAGVKTFSDAIAGNITGNAATVTTNANLIGDVTSIGNTTTYNGIVPISKGGTGSATQNFVDLTTNQTVVGEKTFSNKARLTQLQANGSGGVDVLNNASGSVAVFGAGGSTGTSLLGTTNIASGSADYTQIAGGTGSVTQTATGSSTNIDISLVPKGTGKLKSGANNVILANDKLSALSATTSAELAGVVTDETGTGLAVFGTSPTLTTPNIGAATGTSLTLAGNISAYNYDKDNMLVNGNIENPLSTEWTCTVGTCTKTTTAGEFSSGLAAMKIVPAANVIDVSQSVSTPSGIQKQGFARVIYKVPSTCSTFQVLTTVDSATQTTVPTANLVYDDTFRSIEVPLTFGSTNAGIKFTASTTCTGNIFVDGAILAQGLGLQNLQGDNVYSAKVTTTSGAVTNTNKTGWVTCSAANPTVCTIASGINTQAMNCSATLARSGAQYTHIVNTYSTGVSTFEIFTYEAAGGAVANVPVQLICQKSGNDYLAASSNVYSQASANYSRRAYTPTFTGFGTVSSSTCYESREGEFNVIDCRFVVGTTTATEARVSLPSGLTSSSNIVSGGFIAGIMGRQTSTNNGLGVLIEPSVSHLTFTGGIQTASMFTKQNGNAIAASGDTFSFQVRVPISGWSNSNVIVGTFENVPTVPGAGARIDTFSATFGTTNATTACTASPCSFLNQIGNGVSSVTRSATGTYTVNTSKTYTKLFCLAGPSQSNFGAVMVNQCTTSSCTSFGILSRSVSNVDTDTVGTIHCQGTY